MTPDGQIEQMGMIAENARRGPSSRRRAAATVFAIVLLAAIIGSTLA
jgi:hypothetical protein